MTLNGFFVPPVIRENSDGLYGVQGPPGTRRGENNEKFSVDGVESLPKKIL